MKNSFFKYASLLFAAVMLISCQKTGGDNQTSNALVLKYDKNVIQSNGTDACTFTVEVNGKDVTSESIFFIGTDVLDIKNGKFTTTKPGTYSIWANYGTENSSAVSVMAVDFEIPGSPADTKPSATSFDPRVLMVQFTGVKCGNCPAMMEVMHPILESETNSKKVVWVACHSYNASDPAYLNSSFPNDLGATYPSLNLDYSVKYLNYRTNTTEQLLGLIDEQNASKKATACGIAANAVLEGNKLVARIKIKAAVDNEYRVGAFLMQDGIKATQQSYTQEWMNTHNNCIRFVDAGKDFVGHSLGKLAKGSTTEYLFAWDLDEIWENGDKVSIAWDDWTPESIHFAVFVTAPAAKGWSVNNAVYCKADGQTPFNYAN